MMRKNNSLELSQIGKSGKMSGVAVSLSVVAVIAVLVVAAMLLGYTPQSIGDGEKRSITSCDSTTTPSLTIRAFDVDNKGTALTEGTNIFRIAGQNSWTTFTAGTAITSGISVGDNLEIVMGIDTTDFTDNAYGESFDYTVPCKEESVIEMNVANDEVETSLTATFYNNDQDAAAEVFTAGQTQDVSLKLQAGVDEYFGNPFVGGNPNVLVLELNSTSWDAPEKVSIKGGAELNRYTDPLTRHDPVAGKIAYAYELPVIGEDQVEIVIKLNADDSTAPGVDDTAYLYAAN